MERNNPPLLLHLTTVDLSLELLLGPQLRAFQDAGFEVVTASAPGPYADLLEQDGIVHYPLKNTTRSWDVGKDVKALWELFRLFRRLSPDIVHTHNPKPGVYGRLAAKAARVPVIVNTVHGLYAQDDDRALKRWACWGSELVSSWCSDAELVQNSEDLATLARVGVSKNKLRLFGNGVDLERFTAVGGERRQWARREFGASDQDIVVGCVARLTNEKGIPELLDAFEAAKAKVPDLHLVLIGPAERSRRTGVDEILVRAQSLGVTVLGMREDVAALYEGMDIFVLPSHREGFPRSVMEAAAMGLPVVGTDIRGMREAVSHGETGSLVPVMDPDAIAGALVQLATDPSLRSDQGRNARLKAEREFDVASQVAMSLDVYNSVLAQR